MKKKKRDTISVIIPTRNRPELLKVVLTSLLSQAPSVSEIIIIDTSNELFQEKTRRMVRVFPSDKIIYRTLIDASASKARNFGIAQSTGSIIAFLDDDSVPELGWALAIHQAVKVGPFWFRGLCVDASVSSTIVHHFYAFYKELTTQDFKRQWSLLGRWKRYQIVGLLQAGNFFVSRDTLMNMRPVFDERLFPFIAEETDLSQRIRKSGNKILYVPRAKVRHHFLRLGYRSFVLYSAFWYGRALVILNERVRRSLVRLGLFGQIASGELQKKKHIRFWNLMREGHELFRVKYSQGFIYDIIFLFICINFLGFHALGSLYGTIENLWLRRAS